MLCIDFIIDFFLVILFLTNIKLGLKGHYNRNLRIRAEIVISTININSIPFTTLSPLI